MPEFMIGSKFDVNKNFDDASWSGLPRARILHAMAKQLVTPRFKQRRRLYLREWRKHRGYTLEQFGEMVGMTPGNLSHLERGLIPYNQDFLEAAAEALQTDPASLMMRDPSQPDAIWSVWEQATPGQRAQIVEVVKALIRTGT